MVEWPVFLPTINRPELYLPFHKEKDTRISLLEFWDHGLFLLVISRGEARKSGKYSNVRTLDEIEELECFAYRVWEHRVLIEEEFCVHGYMAYGFANSPGSVKRHPVFEGRRLFARD